MTDRGLRIAALGVGALTLALVTTTVVLVVATGGRAANQFDQPWAEVAAAVTVLAGTTAGLAIVLRRPRNRIGWIVLAPSFTLALEDMAVPAIVGIREGVAGRERPENGRGALMVGPRREAAMTIGQDHGRLKALRG